MNISSNLTVSSTVVNSGNLIATGTSVLQIQSGSSLEVTGSQYNSGSLLITGSITLTSGSVTMPHRPAFRVYGAGSTDRVGTYTMSGSNFTLDYNQGSHFNISNGRFTAPLSGLYNIYYNGRVGSVNSMMQVIIYKNGPTGTVLLMWEAPGLAASSHFGVSTVAYLAAGDYISAVVAVGAIQFDGNDSFGATYIG